MKRQEIQKVQIEEKPTGSKDDKFRDKRWAQSGGSLMANLQQLVVFSVIAGGFDA